MAISEALGNFYAKLEDGFFSVMDFLEDKGIPVYNVINVIEERGIPAFPAFLASFLILVLLVYALFFVGAARDVSAELRLTDQFDQSLGEVELKVYDEADKPIKIDAKLWKSGDAVLLKNVPVGMKLKFVAKKAGHNDAEYKTNADDKEMKVFLRLDKVLEVINGKIKLIDAETGDSVKNAQIVARLARTGEPVTCSLDQDGTVECAGVPAGEKILLSVKADNYEELSDQEIAFFAGQEGELSLAPKPGAAVGASLLIVRVYDEKTNEFVPDVKVSVYNAETDELLEEKVDEDGDFRTRIAKGTSVRVVVQKDGYMTYDSSKDGLEKTLRDDEELFVAILKEGGKTIHVSVLSKESNLVLSNATVMLFDDEGRLVESKMTEFGGDVSFVNLNAEHMFYVTGIADGYLPGRILAEPAKTTEYSVVLEGVKPENAANVNVFVLDEENKPAENVSLNFYEKSGEELLPLGLPEQKTDVTGYFGAVFQIGKNLFVRASTDRATAEGELTVDKEASKNKLELSLAKKEGIVMMKLVDAQGTPIRGGKVVIESLSGQPLYVTDDTSGEIFFDPEGNSTVKFTYTFSDGSVYTEEIYVKDRPEVAVKIIGTDVSGLTPKVEFAGVEDIDGRPVEGLVRGRDYYLKFLSEWPAGNYEGGVHVRLGPDEIAHVDSHDLGILGFSGIAAKSVYGRTFTPLPEPGQEAIDMQNIGRPGEYNRWLNLLMPPGAGAKIVKVRVKAKETGTLGVYPVHFRGWTNVGGRYFRYPVDGMLNFAPYAAQRNGLYAQAQVAEINVFDAKPSCENELCASFRFVKSDGTELPAENFKALLGGLYALEIQLSPTERTSVQVKASTSKSAPIISFTGSAISSFADFPDSNSMETSIDVKEVSADPTTPQRVRLYFKATSTGSSNITVQLITQQTVINRTFDFSVYKDRFLTATPMPAVMTVGEDFRIVVKDDEGNFVENATVKIFDGEKRLALQVRGDGSARRGLNGIYYFKNNLRAAKYSFTVEAEGFKPTEGFIEISKEGALLIVGEAKIVIPKGGQSGDAQITVVNSTSDVIENLTFDFVGAQSEDFELRASLPSSLRANSRERATISAVYKGEKERANFETTLRVRGRVFEKFNTSAETRVTVDFNPKLPEASVTFSKSRLVIFLVGQPQSGAPYQSSARGVGYLEAKEPKIALFQAAPLPPTIAPPYAGFPQPGVAPPFGGAGVVPGPFGFQSGLYPQQGLYGDFVETVGEAFLSVTNRSTLPIQFETEIKPRGPSDRFLRIDVEQLRLEPLGSTGATKTIRVAATNALPRNLPQRRFYNFDLVFKSEELTRTIPLQVVLWNPTFALEINRNIEVYLAQDPVSGSAEVRVPIYARNFGQTDIEQLRFGTTKPMEVGNIEVTFLPSETVPVLPRGSALLPPPMMIVKARRTDKSTLEEKGEISVKGTINGKEYEFGPILLTAHISPPACLQVTPNNISFIDETGKKEALTETVIVKNNCAEPVGLRSVLPNTVGSNPLGFLNPFIVIPPTQSMPVEIFIGQKERSLYDLTVTLVGFLERSQTVVNSSPIMLHVELGQVTAMGKAGTYNTVTLEECKDEKSATAPEKTVYLKIPKIATATSRCDAAYCDAEMLSEFLSDKIESYAENAKRVMTTYRNEVAATGCAAKREALQQGFCSFESLGIRPERFDVYFQHDNFTIELFRDILQKKSRQLAGYHVMISGAESFGSYLGGGLAKRILFTDAFSGCGRYRVKISGAVQTVGPQMVPDQLDILVDLSREKGVPARELTEQCTAEIQNFLNFMPIDKSYSIADKKFTWLGVVRVPNKDDEDALKSLGKDFAKELFNKEDRYIGRNTTERSNVLEVKFHDEPTYTIKLSMPKTEQNEPYVITAAVKKFLAGKGTQQTDAQREIVREAAETIAKFRQNRVDGCITADKRELRIKAKAELGKLELQGCKDGKLSLQYAETCCDFEVTSEFPDVYVLRRPEGDKVVSDPLDGVESYLIKHGNETFSEKPVKLELDKKSGYHKGKMQLCVKGKDDRSKAHGKKILLHVHSAFEETNEKESLVELQMCGVHPYEIPEELNKIQLAEGETAERLGTVVWKGPPEIIMYSQVEMLNHINELLGKSKEISAGKAPAGKSEYESQAKRQRQMAIWGFYLPACSVASFVSGLVLKMGIGAFFSPVFDCLVPAGLQGTAWGKAFVQMLPSWLGGEDLDTKMQETEKLIQEGKLPPTEGAERSAEDLLQTGAFSSALWAGLYGEARAYGAVTATTREAVANDAARKLTREIADNYLPNATSGQLGKIKKHLSGKIKDALKPYDQGKLDFFTRERPLSISGVNPKTGKLVMEEAIENAITDLPTGVEDELKEALKQAAKNQKAHEIYGKAFQQAEKAMQTEVDAIKDSILKKISEAHPTDLKVAGSTVTTDYTETTVKNSIEELTGNAKAAFGAKGIPFDETKFRDLASKIIKPDPVDPNYISPPKGAAATDILERYPAVRNVPAVKYRVTPATYWSQNEGAILDELIQTRAVTDPERKAAGEFLVGVTNKAKETARLRARWTGFKDFFVRAIKNMGTKTFLRELGKGVITGALAQAAGYGAWQGYWSYVAKPIEVTRQVTGKEVVMAPQPDGTVVPTTVDTADKKLVRLKSYNFTMKKKGGLTKVEIEDLTDFKDEYKDEKLWLGKCDGKAFEKSAERFMPTLLPDPTPTGNFPTKLDGKEFAQPEAAFVAKYYEGLGPLIAEAASMHKLPEALLVTIAIWKSDMAGEWPTRCEYGRRDTRDADDSFACAANVLAEFINTGKCQGFADDAGILCLLREYDRKYPFTAGPASEEDLQFQLKRYTIWSDRKLVVDRS